MTYVDPYPYLADPCAYHDAFVMRFDGLSDS